MTSIKQALRTAQTLKDSIYSLHACRCSVAADDKHTVDELVSTLERIYEEEKETMRFESSFLEDGQEIIDALDHEEEEERVRERETRLREFYEEQDNSVIRHLPEL